MSKFPPGSIRARVAEYGDAWMTNGSVMPINCDLSAEVGDELVMERAASMTGWPNTTFEQRERFRRKTFLLRAFLDAPEEIPHA